MSNSWSSNGYLTTHNEALAFATLRATQRLEVTYVWIAPGGKRYYIRSLNEERPHGTLFHSYIDPPNYRNPYHPWRKFSAHIWQLLDDTDEHARGWYYADEAQQLNGSYLTWEEAQEALDAHTRYLLAQKRVGGDQ